MSRTINIALPDGSGSFPGYLAEPAESPRAAVIVVQEIFGLNAGMRRRCDLLAEAGYLAIAPDLFWRIAPGIELDPDIKPEMDHAMELMNQFDQDQAIEDIRAAIQTARELLGGHGKVGAVGYCMGGRLAYLVAVRTDIDATAAYYAFGIDEFLGEKDQIKEPLMIHLGKKDRLIDPAAQARIHAGLDGQPHVTVYDYEGADHGFATEFGQRRLETAARLADERTAKLFAENLKPS